MPTFCRHNRFEESCPICGRKPRTRPGTVSGAAGARRATADRPATKRRTPRASDLVVRRVARAQDDGYENDLVPGVRATADAQRLAEELAWSAARLQGLGDDPPGLLATAVALDDPEEALWLTFLIAYLSPLEDVEDPFAAIAEVHTSWASGEMPELADVPLGPRTAHAPGRGLDTLLAYRSRAEKAGGQAVLFAGETALTPARRFERGFERLSLPHLHRAARYEFLLLTGGLGLLEVKPSSLLFGVEAMDPATLAAKRVFGIGDAINLQRRATELLTACDIPPGALDLALVNWARGADDRITAGSQVVADPEVVAKAEAALAVRPSSSTL